jgi:hypothetical protein
MKKLLTNISPVAIGEKCFNNISLKPLNQPFFKAKMAGMVFCKVCFDFVLIRNQKIANLYREMLPNKKC